MLDKVRDQCQAEKRPFRYPGTCRNKKAVGPNAVVRVIVPSSGETGFTDLIRGPISMQNKDIDDWVILRANGTPTYNFSVVIDDHDLGITHVLRGDDHINNTPKQILLYQTLGFAVPHFAHLPMILGPDKTKLSKRHGAASTLEYRAMGYLPDAMINFLVRLGWSHGDQEIFTTEELQRYFDLDHIGKASAVFSPDKLNWVSGHIMTRTPAAEFRVYLESHFKPQIGFMSAVGVPAFEAAIGIIQGKVKTLLEMIDQLGCLFGADPTYDFAAVKAEERGNLAGYLGRLSTALAASDFSKADLEAKVRAEATALGIKLTPLAQALRFAVTGGKHSPALFDMLELQGKERVLRRVRNTQQALAAVG
jgi:glutamyl-tRNA synthetase